MKLQKLLKILKEPVETYHSSSWTYHLTHDKSRELEKEKVENLATPSDLPIKLHLQKYDELAQSISTGLTGGSTFKAEVQAALKKANEKIEEVLSTEITNGEDILKQLMLTVKKASEVEINISLLCRLQDEVEEKKYILQYSDLGKFLDLEKKYRILAKEINYYEQMGNNKGENDYLGNEIVILQKQNEALEKLISEKKSTSYTEEALNRILKQVEMQERSTYCFNIKNQIKGQEAAISMMQECLKRMMENNPSANQKEEKNELENVPELQNIRLNFQQLRDHVSALQLTNKKNKEAQTKLQQEKDFLTQQLNALRYPQKKYKEKNSADDFENGNPNHTSEVRQRRK